MKTLNQIFDWDTEVVKHYLLHWKNFYIGKQALLQSLRNVDFNPLVMNHDLVQESISSTGKLNTIFLNANYMKYNIVTVMFSYLFQLTFLPAELATGTSFRFDDKY